MIFADFNRNLGVYEMSHNLPYFAIEKSLKFLHISFGNGIIYEKKVKILKRLNKYENIPGIVFVRSSRNPLI